MTDFRQALLEFALQREALGFDVDAGFQLKSGRTSPYFFNAGKLFETSRGLAQLGRLYADAITAAGVEFDVLFGPAYKGIPLAAGTAVALAEAYDRDVPYCFNRKEKKAHGEGGVIVGAPLQGRVLIIDDVITAGTAIRESLQLIDASGATAAGVVVALDRQEKAPGSECSAIQQIEQEYHVPVVAVATLGDLLGFLATANQPPAVLTAVQQYRDQYGV